MDLLANIDESELEGLLHDPDFLNIDPNLSADERKKIIEEIRFAPIETISPQPLSYLLAKNMPKRKSSKFRLYPKRNFKKSTIH